MEKSSKGVREGRLFVLDLSGRVFSINPDGSDEKTLVTGCPMPDGIAVDVAAGYMYWTDMGVRPDANDGKIERADLDGGNRRTIIPPGATHTPKQMHLDKAGRKLYWCDREGMRVMRANLDGSNIETLVQAGDPAIDGDEQTKWCVGITLDTAAGHIYWTQKGGDDAGTGRIFRADIEIPKGQTASNRSDIVTLFENLPEPIDLEFDEANRTLYWTDRGDPPRGNTVNRWQIDSAPNPEILVTHLLEGIGLALDVPNGRMFVTDLGGSLYVAKLDGTGKHPLAVARGNLAGVAYAEL